MFAYEPMLWILFLFLIIWFWQDALRAKELATLAGKRACRQAAVEFLDDSVMFRRFRRLHGIRLRREYEFEFSVDGSRRFHGSVALEGRRIVSVNMEPYPIQNEDEL